MITSQYFPPVETADEFGLLAVSEELPVELLLDAYMSGIFPWPMPEYDFIPWFAPATRAILVLDQLHVSRSLKKLQTRKSFRFASNLNFREVIRACAEPRAGGGGTWITPKIIDAYTSLHAQGYAHSIECYDEGDLIGGLYGVAVGGMFAAESMFYRRSNASKLCLLEVCSFLGRQGVEWIDCQQKTPVSSGFGAQELARTEFMKKLEQAISAGPLHFPVGFWD